MIEFVTASTKWGTEQCSVNIMIPTPHYMAQMKPRSNQGGCMMCTWYMVGIWYMSGIWMSGDLDVRNMNVRNLDVLLMFIFGKVFLKG